MADDRLTVKPAYSTAEFAEQFGISRTTVYEEMRAGRLKAYKVAQRTCIAGQDALAWLDARRAEAWTRPPVPPGRRRATTNGEARVKAGG